VKFAIVVGKFYEDLAERLVAGAQGVFGGDADVYEVPGAFELPLAAQYLAETGRYAGVACLGAVIRGETDHYDYVCAESARGIMKVSLKTGVPCASACSRSRTWTRRWPGPAAASATRAPTPPRP